MIEFKTSATLLRNLFPNSRYSFSKPDTVVTASFVVETLSNMSWLGGGGYDLVGFYIHDVRVEDRNGRVRHGIYCPLMLENLTDPILTGREELGVPKLFSEISIEEDVDRCSVKISWRGNKYMDLSWKGLAPKEREHDKSAVTPIQKSEGLLVHRYMPSHEVGKSSYENDLLLGDKAHVPSILSHRVSSPSDVTFNIEDLGSKHLPTLHHIISRLAELPMFGIVSGSVIKTEGVTDFSHIEVLN